MRGLHAGERQAQTVLAVAHRRHGSLDGDGVDLAEKRIDKRQVLELQLACASDVARKHAAAHLYRRSRRHVGQHRDDTLAPSAIIGTTWSSLPE